MSQAAIDRWLSLPQAVFLLATGDLARACEWTEADPGLLVYLVARALSSRAVVVPLDPGALEVQRAEALHTARNRLAAEAEGIDRYGASLNALVDILAGGRAMAKGSRTPEGRIETIDQAEFTRVRLVGVHAVYERTKEIAWYDFTGFRHGSAEIPAVGEGGGVSVVSRPRHGRSGRGSAAGQARISGLLEQFVAGLGDKFNGMSDSGVARRFMDQCSSLVKAGKSAPNLPSDRRRIETQVKKIRAQKFAAEAKGTDGNAEQRRLTTHKDA